MTANTTTEATEVATTYRKAAEALQAIYAEAVEADREDYLTTMPREWRVRYAAALRDRNVARQAYWDTYPSV